MAGPLALVFDLIARDGASPAFARVAASADRASVATGRAEKSALSFGKKAGAALAAFASVDFAVHAVEAASKFQRAMLQIQTLAGASAGEVDKLSKSVLSLAGETGQAPEELATSLYHVESIGLRGKKAMDVVKIAAEGAKVGMADLEETTNALTSTVASGIPGVKNMSQAMGALIAIVGEGDMKFSDLNEALGSGILSVVKGYGLSLRDVGAALATFGDNNIRGAEAATALRMAVQALAVPAKAGKGAIESIGLTMKTLQLDMQHGGLNAAIIDLNKHMKAAGITGVQVGGFLTQAFGKRAGIGLSVLMGQFDRFEGKFASSGRASGEFASKWDATTHTAGVAFDRLRSKLDVFTIEVGTKLLPAVTAAAQWLGTNVPRAFHRLVDIVGPTAHLVGNVLGAAWKGLQSTLEAVGGALHAVGQVLSEHKTLVTTVGTAVLGMWAAFKLYKLAVLAIRAVSTEFSLIGTRVGLARVAVSQYGVAANAAMGLVGVAVIAATSVWAHHQAEVAKQKARVDELTEAYKLDTGAIADNTRAAVAHTLQSEGVLDAANKVGLSLKTVTDAALGNKDAVRTVDRAYKAFMSTQGSAGDVMKRAGNDSTAIKTWNKIKDSVAGTNGELNKAIQVYKNEAEAQGKSTDGAKKASAAQLTLTRYQKNLASAQQDLQIDIDGTTYAMRGQSTEADVLNAALARLSGDKNAVAESQLALKDSLDSVTQSIKDQAKQYKDHGTSLAENTAEGRKNLEWLHQQIDQINSIASAQIKQGASTKTVTRTLGENEQALRNAAIAAGLNKDQVDALIKKYAATPKQVETYIIAHSNKADTAILTTQKKIDNLTAQKQILLKMDPHNHAVTEALAQIDSDIANLVHKPHPITLTLNVLGAAGVGKAVHDAVNNIPKAYRVTPVAGPAPRPGAVVPHARGGLMSPGWNLLGEYGPELYNRASGEVLTAPKTAARRGMGGGNNVTINQTINNATPEPASVSGPASVRKAAKSIERAI